VRRLIVDGLQVVLARCRVVMATVTLKFVFVLPLVDRAQAITDDRLGLQVPTACVAVRVVRRPALIDGFLWEWTESRNGRRRTAKPDTRWQTQTSTAGRLGAFHAQGTRIDTPYLYDSNSTTSGATVGIGSRLYPLAVRRMRIFIEGAAEILYTPGGSDFPPGGTGTNAFLRTGAPVRPQPTCGHARVVFQRFVSSAGMMVGSGTVAAGRVSPSSVGDFASSV
jgi:hypothetical protein